MTAKKHIIWFVVTLLLFAGAIAALFVTTSSYEFVDAKDAQVTISSLKVEKSGSIKVDWQCDNAAVTSYRVYRRENSASPTLTVRANNLKYYQDSNTKNGTVYTYYVTAYNSKTETKSEGSKAISICKDTSAETVPLEEIKPELSFEFKSNNKPVLKWKPVKNVPMTSVCLYKKNEAGVWSVENVFAPYITECDAEQDAEYKIVVRYSENEEVLVSSLESDIVKVVE